MLFTKPLLIAIIAACSVPSNSEATEQPDDKEQPQEKPEEDQHFCCQEINQEKQTGEGCSYIDEKYLITCSKVLYCQGDWSLVEGKAKCS
jgi:hypothetical protein